MSSKTIRKPKRNRIQNDSHMEPSTKMKSPPTLKLVDEDESLDPGTKFYLDWSMKNPKTILNEFCTKYSLKYEIRAEKIEPYK
uniref:Uncharacterized protein n=1 Tax=Acrobeloides nanus TaxID=290746 RepID=A0A914DGL7_9BILA